MADLLTPGTGLAALSVAILGDTLEAAGLPDQVLAPHLRPLGPGRRFAGPAVCLSGAAGDGPGLTIDQVDGTIGPGAVVVLGPANGCALALAGGNMVTAWRRRGMAALITDGHLRDTADYPDLPAIAAGRSPRNCRGHWRILTLDQPVTLPGAGPAGQVRIHPGDWLIGDEDGVIALPCAHAARLAADAATVARIEAAMRAEILSGRPRGMVYGGHDRFGHVRRI